MKLRMEYSWDLATFPYSCVEESKVCSMVDGMC